MLKNVKTIKSLLNAILLKPNNSPTKNVSFIQNFKAEYLSVSLSERGDLLSFVFQTSNDLLKSNICDNKHNINISPFHTILQELSKQHTTDTDNNAGIDFIVKLKKDINELSYNHSNNDNLKIISSELDSFIKTLFHHKDFKLDRIFVNSPAKILNDMRNYEANHAINCEIDLLRRIADNDRRVFALKHDSSNKLLSYLHIALMNHIPDTIKDIIETEASNLSGHDFDCAIFYSISSPFSGVINVNIGHHTIMLARKALAIELPYVKHFLTLSNVTGFTNWLFNAFDAMSLIDTPVFDVDSNFLMKNLFVTHQEWEQFVHNVLPILSTASVISVKEFCHSLKSFLSMHFTHSGDVKSLVLFKNFLTKVVARYLIDLPLKQNHHSDKVANFHLKNGAEIAAINWMGDTSERAMKLSLGFMVNYDYTYIERLENNAQNYLKSRIINCSPEVRTLLLKS